MDRNTIESAIRTLAADQEMLERFRADPAHEGEALGLDAEASDVLMRADRDRLRAYGVGDGLSILVSRWFANDIADSGSHGAFVVDRISPLPPADVPVNLVFAGACSHVPDILARPEIDDPDAVTRLKEGYAELGRRIAAADLDVLIVTTDCHFQSFETGAFVIGVADRHEGSLAFFKRADIALSLTGDVPLAKQIGEAARQSGLEVELAQRVDLDHGLIVPLAQMLPRDDLPVVPIVTQPARSFSPFNARAFGQAVRSVVGGSGRRVGILATGGLSHWLDPGKFGTVDREFDTYILDMIGEGRGIDLADLEPFPLLAHGQYEFLNWIIMLGLVGPGVRGDIICYEPMEASGGGWAVLEMTLPAHA